MPVEFIGFVSSQNHSEIISPEGPIIDLPHIGPAAKIHESYRYCRSVLHWEPIIRSNLFGTGSSPLNSPRSIEDSETDDCY